MKKSKDMEKSKEEEIIELFEKDVIDQVGEITVKSIVEYIKKNIQSKNYRNVVNAFVYRMDKRIEGKIIDLDDDFKNCLRMDTDVYDLLRYFKLNYESNVKTVFTCIKEDPKFD